MTPHNMQFNDIHSSSSDNWTNLGITMYTNIVSQAHYKTVFQICMTILALLSEKLLIFVPSVTNSSTLFRFSLIL